MDIPTNLEAVMDFYLLSYATEAYVPFQKRLEVSSKKCDFKRVVNCSDKDILGTEFYERNKKLLSCKKGAGYWLWKPYIILKLLDEVEKDDVVLYADVHHYVDSNELLPFIVANLDRGMFAVGLDYKNARFTKRETFEVMGCDSEKYWYGTHCEAGQCAFSNNEFCRKFLEEWLHYAEDEKAVSDVVTRENLPEYQEHRHDQSIFSLLCLKYNVRTMSSIVFWNFLKEDRTYPEKVF